MIEPLKNPGNFAMEKTATVFFDGEVFRPEAPVDLVPNTRYVISIGEVPGSRVPATPIEGGKTAWDVLDELAGSIDGPVGNVDEKPARAENLSDLLARLAGTIDGPPDWSAEHDHYIHGTSKRYEGDVS